VTFEPEDAAVLQPVARDGPADFLDATEEALGAEEVALGKARGHGEQESAVAAAEVDLERCRARENVGHFRATNVIARLPERALRRGKKRGLLLVERFFRHGMSLEGWVARRNATAVEP
jgi:hypothetical protein